VQIAACGTPVLFHDTNLARTSNGAGPLGRRSLAELATLDAGAWFSPAHAGERIPTLEDALACVQGRISRVYCEVKAYRELEDIDRIVALTHEAALQELTVFISLDWRALDHIALLEASARLGYIVDKADRFEAGLEKASARAGNRISESMVAAITQVAKVMQLETVAEYVESRKTRALLSKLGVDFAQGHAIGKPRDLDDVLVELTGKKRLSSA
jgi:glycerophosphoryl diester phosphodiesterase